LWKAFRDQANGRKVAKTSPESFVAIAARICPNDVRLTLEQAIPGGMSLEDYSLMPEMIAARMTAGQSMSDTGELASLVGALAAFGVTGWVMVRLMARRNHRF
jgi:hypothetical protein